MSVDLPMYIIFPIFYFLLVHWTVGFDPAPDRTLIFSNFLFKILKPIFSSGFICHGQYDCLDLWVDGREFIQGHQYRNFCGTLYINAFLDICWIYLKSEYYTCMVQLVAIFLSNFNGFFRFLIKLFSCSRSNIYSRL